MWRLGEQMFVGGGNLSPLKTTAWEASKGPAAGTNKLFKCPTIKLKMSWFLSF